MARSEITLAAAGINSANAVTADAVDTSNNHFLDVNNVKDENVVFRLYGGSDGFTAVFKAGDFSEASIGDLSIAVAASTIKVVTIESARFKDSDEYILIDASSTGTATAATIEAYEKK
jgi:hypothetical protein